MNTLRMLSVSLCAAAAAVCLLIPGPALAQHVVEVRQAELAVPFGVAAGKVVLVADQFVFVDDGQLDASFAIARGNIVSFELDAGIVTITTRMPVVDRTGRRTVLRVRVPDATPLMRWYRTEPAAHPAMPAMAPAAVPMPAVRPDATPADEPEVLIYQARHDHRFGSCEGRLIVTDKRLAYESVSDIGDSRQWVYADIKEVKQDGPYKLKVTPFTGNEYNLELLGSGLDSGQFRELVNRITQARIKR